LFEDNNSTSGLGSWSSDRVAEILRAISITLDDASVDYELPCDGVAGVVGIADFAAHIPEVLFGRRAVWSAFAARAAKACY
jgi:hypothetical protein